MINWILLVVTSLVSFINNFTIIVSNNTKSISGKKIYITLVSIIFILIIGLRNTDVGVDTRTYGILFENASLSNSFYHLLNTWHHEGIEKGYTLLEYIISRRFGFTAFLIITSFVVITPIMYTVFKDSKNYWFSIFILVAFGYFSFFMSGIRQSIAIALCFVAYRFAIKNKLLYFILSILCATFFHQTALIFIPVYWIVKIKPSRNMLYIFFLGLFLSSLLGKYIFTILNLFSRQQYETMNNVGGYGLFFLTLFTFMLGILFRRSYFIDRSNVNILLMVGISVLLWPITRLNVNMFRLFYYYHIFIILYIPNLVKCLQSKSLKIVLMIIYLVIGCYYLYNYVINTVLGVSQYTFFWQ